MEENRSPYQEYKKEESASETGSGVSLGQNTPDAAASEKDSGKKPNKSLRIGLIVVAAIVVLAGCGVGFGMMLSDTHVSDTAASTETNSDHGITIEDTPSQEESTPESGERLTSVQVAQKVTPSVVGIVRYARDASGTESAESSGSGVILSEDGYILTCSHVVNDGDITGHIEVVFTDGSKAKATLVGYDTQTDLAVIHADKNGLTPAEFGDSNQLMVGEPVYVIGSPSGIEYLGSFAGGYVSAVNREILVGTKKYKLACIQTDAAINPGNSGGPLINEYGQVVGINSAKLVSTNVEGMGFAVPSDTAQTVVKSILESGYVTGRPKIGITFTSIDKDLADAAGIPQGIRVVGISADCDVANKDVKIGDIITKVDGEAVTQLNEIAALLNKKQPGDTITLTIYRALESGDTKTFEEKVVLSEMTQS